MLPTASSQPHPAVSEFFQFTSYYMVMHTTLDLSRLTHSQSVTGAKATQIICLQNSHNNPYPQRSISRRPQAPQRSAPSSAAGIVSPSRPYGARALRHVQPPISAGCRRTPSALRRSFMPTTNVRPPKSYFIVIVGRAAGSTAFLSTCSQERPPSVIDGELLESCYSIVLFTDSSFPTVPAASSTRIIPIARPRSRRLPGVSTMKVTPRSHHLLQLLKEKFPPHRS